MMEIRSQSDVENLFAQGENKQIENKLETPVLIFLYCFPKKCVVEFHTVKLIRTHQKRFGIQLKSFFTQNFGHTGTMQYFFLKIIHVKG